jgi:SAM-dependent methyltransferase
MRRSGFHTERLVAKSDHYPSPGPTKLEFASYNLIKRLSLAEGFWFCTPVGSHDAAVKFEGFLVPPLIVPQSFSIEVNDKRIKLQYGRNDSSHEIFARVEQIYDLRDRFTFSFDLDGAACFPDQDVISLRLDSLQSRSTLPFYFSKSIDLPVPESRGMLRTTRISDIDTFNFTGLTDFGRLRLLIEGCLPLTTMDHLRILDWGCGCGRLSRFMESHFGEDRVFGVDIDPVNIKWDQQNLDNKRYTLVAAEAALPFLDQSFDFIYGISVMTHLGLDDQCAWLRELHRVLAVRGILILTYHGLAAFFAHVNDGAMLDKYLANGFLDCGRNSDLDEGSSENKDRNSYRNSFNTIENIASQMIGLFSIEKFVGGGHMGQQDYVVLRKI